MTRGLTPAALGAVSAEAARGCLAVELLFPAGAVRFVAAPFDITLGGETFSGVGQLVEISVIEETSELAASGMTVGLSGIPRDLVAVALGQAYQNRRGTVWWVPLDAAELPVADPILLFRGRMDTMEIQMGETATVRVRLESRLADWERPNLRRYTHEDQVARHPGDLFFIFVSATTEKELIWPARTFR
jgi:hypothetical protein